jgi:ABC-type transport system involved in multi-copper enzyme maturation permease subunit
MLSAFLIFLSISSFVGSYLEAPMIFSLNSMFTLVGIICCSILVVISHSTASNVDLEITGGKCPFILPQFSQDQLMQRGCSGKYLSFSEQMEDLTCKKADIARIWEDNTNILVVD